MNYLGMRIDKRIGSDGQIVARLLLNSRLALKEEFIGIVVSADDYCFSSCGYEDDECSYYWNLPAIDAWNAVWRESVELGLAIGGKGLPVKRRAL